MNKAIFNGRAVADIELRTTQSGKFVSSFSVANNIGYGEKKQTSFIDVVAWGTLAENASKYVHKGDEVNIVGTLRTRLYKDKDGKNHKVTEVVASEVEFVKTKKSDDEPAPANAPAFTPSYPAADAFEEISEEDLPF